MKVLFITSAYPSHQDDARGIFIHRLARSLCREGIHVAAVAPGAPDAKSYESMDGVEVHRATYWLPRWQSLATGLSGIVPNLRHRPWLLFQVPSLIAALTWQAAWLADSFDVIHAHWVYPAGFSGLIAAKCRNIPLVVTSHGGDLNLARVSSILTFFVRHICRHASGCVAVSRDLYDNFLALSLPASRVFLIPYGIDLINAIPVEGRPASDEYNKFRKFRGLRILYLGSLTPRKSVETLIQAHWRLEQSPHAIMTAIVGSGPSKNGLVSLVNSRKLRNVLFVDPQRPSLVPAWMSAADVLVLPSISEGRPNVVLEAMACGLPVVATDIAGTRELVRHQNTGLLFPVGDVSDLSACLEKLIGDNALRGQLAQRGREYVAAEHLSTPEITRKYIDVYNHVCAPVKAN